MKTFYQPIDQRSRIAMTSYLEKHFRYPTMNSWNRSTSYACNLKITHLNLDAETEEKLYELMQTQEFYDIQNGILYEFGEQHDFLWQAGMNGRSAGYLVLYQGEKKRSGYQSYCTNCGQKNYQPATESNCTCGVCGQAARVNFPNPHMHVITYPGRGTDDDACFEDWSVYELRNRVCLVQDFDRLADRMIAEALYLCRNYDVAEETVYVPQKHTVLKMKI